MSLKELEDVTSELDDSIAMVSNYQFITAMSKCLTDAEDFQTSVAAKLLKTKPTVLRVCGHMQPEMGSRLEMRLP